MEVAHGVDTEDVGEEGNHDQVCHQSKHIATEVLKEVDWTEKHWHEVNGKHDHSCQHKEGEVSFVLLHILVCIWVFYELMWHET